MRRKVFRYSFLCALLFVFVTAVFMFTACGKEETVKEKEENKKENKKIQKNLYKLICFSLSTLKY